MASSYSILSAFNNRSAEGADRTRTARFQTRDISVYDIYSSDRNFYPQEGVEQKAAEILSVGLLSSLAVAAIPSDSGVPYRLISGERRWRALRLLVERGYKEFETVTCQIRNPANEHEEMVELIIANSAREKDIALQLREAQALKRELQYMKEHNLKLNGYDLQSGKLRDVIADMMNLSKTKVAELDAVANHLILEFVKPLESRLITFSAAYQLSKLAADTQKELFEHYQDAGELSCKDVIAYAKQKAEEDKEEQLPGQMKIESYPDVLPVPADGAAEETLPADEVPEGCGKVKYSDESVEAAAEGYGEVKCADEAVKKAEETAVPDEETVKDAAPDKDAVDLCDKSDESIGREMADRDKMLESKEFKIEILEKLIEEKKRALSLYDSCKDEDDDGTILRMEQEDRVALLAFYSYKNLMKYGHRILEKRD